MFTNKVLLITGRRKRSSEIGQRLLVQLLKTDIGEIRVCSRDEKKQHDMRTLYADPKLRFYIGDVRNEQSVRDAMIGVNFVFHAAALKQVPSCEFFSLKALWTNPIEIMARVMARNSMKRSSPERRWLSPKISADNRDLNYAHYFSERRHEMTVHEDYNSHNVKL
ncbi:MAG TPA: polysaccharide biosynthesis protein [Armatimonadota bacterium]|nr:polysaccharide biosynthesis protein [Armatimonadota bacterium]